MAVPQAKDTRLFYRTARRRYGDARILWAGSHYTGATYMAGYGVERILKALLLSSVRTADHPDVVGSFRGSKAHNFEWLRSRYLRGGGRPFPPEVQRHFTFVADWSTDLHYGPAELGASYATRLLRSAGDILAWSYGRF